MNKIMNYLSVLAIFVAGYVTLAIKDAVHDLNYQLGVNSRQIAEERSAINILKAEFAFLQSPKRLRALVEKHLELSSIKSDQIAQDPLTSQESEVRLAESSQTVKMTQKTRLFKQVRWNYKSHGGQSNIQTVDHRR